MADLVHGRASTYNNYKCRCDECRKAWADYIREGGYVRRYQEKKRQERLTEQKKSDILPRKKPGESYTLEEIEAIDEAFANMFPIDDGATT